MDGQREERKKNVNFTFTEYVQIILFLFPKQTYVIHTPKDESTLKSVKDLFYANAKAFYVKGWDMFEDAMMKPITFYASLNI